MKTKKIFFLFLISFGYTILFGQRENDNWYFGNNAAINFSNIMPIVPNDSQIQSFEACGTASDSNTGNLLFYCNANTIWNRQHQIMQNGSGLLGGNSSQQLAIVKNPANSNQYFVFTTPEIGGSNNKITYSIVDMSLGIMGSNGLPLGAVIQNFKNIPVLDNIGNTFGTEAITAVSGSTANTYWVLIPNQNQLFSYKIDSQGFSNGNPVMSNLNYQTNLNSTKFFSIKASPKLNNPNFSNYICISNWETFGASNTILNKVLSFNSTTGTVTNNFSLDVNSYQTYLPEFNQNASVLFLGYKDIFAVDLVNSTNSNINVMQIYNDNSNNSPYPNTLQRNKYGDIYISRYNNTFLGKINNPNVYGANINVNLNYINLGQNKSATHGLPQLIPTLDQQSEGYYPCIDDLILTSENNLSFYYEIGNTITTQDSYILGSRHNITMQAGKSVTLLPGTDIQLGAKYYAFIAPCGRKEESSSKLKPNNNQKNMVLNLDMGEKNILDKQIDIYPNPASDYITINTGNEKLVSWEMYDMSGKNILKGNTGEADVHNLLKGNYILKLNLEKRQLTKTVILK